MDACRHGQEVAHPLLKCFKVFCALVVTAKRSVDELFMHLFSPVTPNLPTPGKNPTGAHATYLPCLFNNTSAFFISAG